MNGRVNVEGGLIGYESIGAGPPLCILNQFIESRARGPLADAFSDLFTCHAVNPRGIGDSGPVRDDSDLSVESYVDDVEQVRAKLKVPSWVVVGGSTGGMAALLYALRHPNSVRGLVLVCSAASGRFAEGSLFDPRHPRNPEVQQANARAMEGPQGIAAWQSVLWRLSVVDPERTPEPWGHNPPEVSRPRMAAFGEQLPSIDLEPRLRAITASTLVLAGRFDPLCPVPNSERIASAIPRARLHVFERSGHHPYVEEPDDFRDVVRRFALETGLVANNDPVFLYDDD